MRPKPPIAEIVQIEQHADLLYSIFAANVLASLPTQLPGSKSVQSHETLLELNFVFQGAGF